MVATFSRYEEHQPLHQGLVSRKAPSRCSDKSVTAIAPSEFEFPEEGSDKSLTAIAPSEFEFPAEDQWDCPVEGSHRQGAKGGYRFPPPPLIPPTGADFSEKEIYTHCSEEGEQTVPYQFQNGDDPSTGRHSRRPAGAMTMSSHCCLGMSTASTGFMNGT